MSDDLKKDIRRASNANSIMFLLFLALVLVGVFVIRFIFSKAADMDSITMYNLQNLIAYAFQYIVAVPVSIILFRRTKNGKSAPKLKDCFCKPEMPASQIVKWIFIFLFFIFASSYLSNFLFLAVQNITGVELHSANLAADSTWLGILTNVVGFMLMAPLFEEIFFRGTMLRNAARYGSWSMIFSMGIIFSLFHVNYAQTIYTAVLGICSGFLLIKSRSVIPSLLLHFIMNTIGTVQSILIESIDPERLSAGDVDYITANVVPILIMMFTGVLLFGIIIAGLVLLIVELAKNRLNGFRLPCENTEISEKKKFAVYFSAPATIALVLGLIGLTIYNAFTI